MTNIPKLRVVEAPEEKPRREWNPDAIVFGFCLLLLGVIMGSAIVTYQYRHAPPATCERTLPDGRGLMSLTLDADGRESRCTYAAPPHPPIVTKPQGKKK